jgi:hypothetical protein
MATTQGDHPVASQRVHPSSGREPPARWCRWCRTRACWKLWAVRPGSSVGYADDSGSDVGSSVRAGEPGADLRRSGEPGADAELRQLANGLAEVDEHAWHRNARPQKAPDLTDANSATRDAVDLTGHPAPELTGNLTADFTRNPAADVAGDSYAVLAGASSAVVTGDSAADLTGDTPAVLPLFVGHAPGHFAASFALQRAADLAACRTVDFGLRFGVGDKQPGPRCQPVGNLTFAEHPRIRVRELRTGHMIQAR